MPLTRRKFFRAIAEASAYLSLGYLAFKSQAEPEKVEPVRIPQMGEPHPDIWFCEFSYLNVDGQWVVQGWREVADPKSAPRI